MNTIDPKKQLLVRRILFVPTALLAFHAFSFVWEYLYKLLLYIFLPNSFQISIDNIVLIDEILESNISTLISTIFGLILSTGVYFYIGNLFFKNNQTRARNALITLLVAIFIYETVILTNYLTKIELYYYTGIKVKIFWVVLIIFYIANIILWYRFFMNKYEDKEDKELKSSISFEEIYSKPKIHSEPKKYQEIIKRYTLGFLQVIAFIYVVVGHIYFFYALYEFSRENSFLRTLIVGFYTSLWKAFFWVFYI